MIFDEAQRLEMKAQQKEILIMYNGVPNCLLFKGTNHHLMKFVLCCGERKVFSVAAFL